MDPLPEPHRSQIFYFALQDLLRKASAGKRWTWAEVRPDAIVSSSPDHVSSCAPSPLTGPHRRSASLPMAALST